MFKAKIEQLKIAKALKDITGSVGRGKMDNPTDASVYMKAYNENGQGKVKFLSTNFNEWTSCTVDAIGTVDEGVSPLVPHSTLSAMINTINTTFEISLEEKSPQLLSIDYVGRKSPIEIPALLAASFVVEPETVAQLTVQVPCGVLREGLDKASKVISDDPQKLLYNCVNVTLNANNILFECIDSVTRRVMVYVVNHANPVEGSFFVECNKLKKMIEGFDDTKALDIQVGSNNIRVEQDNIMAVLRLTHGTFPKVVGWFPNSFSNEVVFQKDEMINALKRIQAMYENKAMMKACYFSFESMFSTITMNSLKGSITETVTTTLTGDAFSASFVVDTVLRTLYSIDTPDVHMGCSDQGHIIFAPNSPKGFEHRTIVMQLAVKDNTKTA